MKIPEALQSKLEADALFGLSLDKYNCSFYVCLCICVLLYVSMCVVACVCGCGCVCVYMSTYVCLCLHVCHCVCVYMFISMRICVTMCLCIYVFTCVLIPIPLNLYGNLYKTMIIEYKTHKKRKTKHKAMTNHIPVAALCVCTGVPHPCQRT